MPQSTTMTVRLAPEILEKLEFLAKATDRTKAYLASRAIEAYLEEQEWQVRAVEDAVMEADSGNATFLSHDEVKNKMKKVMKKGRGRAAK